MPRRLSMDHMTKTMLSYQNDLKDEIKFDAWYQRHEVWSKTKKQKLIDSILNSYDIGVIYLRNINDQEYEYEVLDGQQRLRSIDQFIDGEYKTDPSLAQNIDRIGFGELEEHNELYPQWVSKQLHFQKITQGDDRAVADFFLRLQEGMDLNTPEILNAIVGEMRTSVIKLSQHQFFDSLGISNKRFRHRLLTAQAFNIEIDGDFQNRSFPSMGRRALRRMYENHRSQVPQSDQSAVQRTLNLLDNVLDDPSFIQNQGDFLPIYMLTRYLKQNYAISGQEETIGEFIREFLLEVENVDIQNTLAITADERPYYNYRDARMSGALSSESFKIRFNVILGQYLEEYSGLRQKAEQRTFDHGQKLAVFQRDDRVCQECDDPVDFAEAEFHHVRRYEDGGPTVVDNGALVHPECHPKGTS
jgi:hypothetical protein